MAISNEDIEAAEAAIAKRLAEGSITNTSVDGLNVTEETVGAELKALKELENRRAARCGGRGMGISKVISRGLQ